MNNTELHPDDLIDRELAGTLSPDERAELAQHRAICSSCAFEHVIASEVRVPSNLQNPIQFDRLINRALDQLDVIHAPVPIAGRRAPTFRWQLVAAVAVLSLAAGAIAAGVASRLWHPRAHRVASTALQHLQRNEPVANAPQVVETRTEAPVVSTVNTRGPELLSLTDTAVASNANVRAERALHHPAHSTPASERETAPVEPSASELFATANVARHGGNYAEAERGYRRLIDQFGNTSEATVSRVALGRMLLDRRTNAPDALSQFDAYLQRAPHGSLAEQAMAGRAQSLHELGRISDERAAWQSLLTAFPDSLYASSARRRIAGEP